MCALNHLENDPLQVYHQLAEEALKLYPDSNKTTVRLLNYSENITYLAENPCEQKRSILRINRPGYHSQIELEAELCWLKELLNHSEIVVASPIAGLNGEYVQMISTDILGNPYHCVMFDFLEGEAPDEENEQGLVNQFEMLGEITARLHNQSQTWSGSKSLKRPVWDFETTLGKTPKWGRWQDGLAINPIKKQLFQMVSDLIKKRLDAFGKSPDRFGLIHADLRLANLLVENETIKVIDFDDCGYSWFLYDLATALSFIEHKPYVPELTKAWVKGYKKIRTLSKEEEREIPTFIMLRRLLLVAWVGSHIDNDTAQKMGEEFTETTVDLTEKYISQFGC